MGKHLTTGDSIEHLTTADVAQDSSDLRRALRAGEHAQLVIMTIPPGGEIGDEAHPRL